MKKITIVSVIAALLVSSVGFAGHCSVRHCWNGSTCVAATSHNTYQKQVANDYSIPACLSPSEVADAAG